VQRDWIRRQRIGTPVDDPARFVKGGNASTPISESLSVVRDARGTHVVSPVGYILSTNDTRWRAGAVAVTLEQPPAEHRILLHADLRATAYYCPASGTLLAVDFHRRDEAPVEDLVLDLASVAALAEKAADQRQGRSG
jgi:N-methylhydantoinase B